MKNYVLDACAVIALYAKEKNHEVIAQIYEEAASGKISLIMHRVNLLEVYYYVFKRESRANADKILQYIQLSQLQNLRFCNSPEAQSCARPKQASAKLIMNQQITGNKPKTAKGRVRLYDEVLQLPQLSSRTI